MKDSDARGLVLKQLYELRDKRNQAELSDFDETGLDRQLIGRMLEQLAQQGLIEWNPKRSSMGAGYLAVLAKITAFGVDVIEGGKPAPIAITIDNSIAVHGSQGVMIGGQGNIQNVTLDVERLNSFIDSSGATVTEKEEAKGLLKQLVENPLVKGALEWFIKFKTGA